MKEFPFQLWHGTSAHLLPQIERHGLGGKNVIAEWRVLEFIIQAFPLLEFDQNNLSDPDHTELTMIGLCARQASHGMNFQHGEVYATGGFEKACSYALTAPEALFFARRLSEIGRQRGNSAIAVCLSQHAEVSNYLSKPPKPIVLKLPGLEAARILNEKGQPLPSWSDQHLDVFERVHDQMSYRITGIIPFADLSVLTVDV